MICRKAVFALLASVLIGLWSVNSALSQDAQLIARWPLDENSGKFVQDVVGGNDGERVEFLPPHPNLHHPLIQDFTDAVLSNREPKVDGAIGRKVARIEAEIYSDSKS